MVSFTKHKHNLSFKSTNSKYNKIPLLFKSHSKKTALVKKNSSKQHELTVQISNKHIQKRFYSPFFKKFLIQISFFKLRYVFQISYFIIQSWRLPVTLNFKLANYHFASANKYQKDLFYLAYCLQYCINRKLLLMVQELVLCLNRIIAIGQSQLKFRQFM